MPRYHVLITKAIPARKRGKVKRGKVKRYEEYAYYVRALSRQNALTVLTEERPLATLYAHSVSVLRAEQAPDPRVKVLRVAYPVSAANAKARAAAASHEYRKHGRLVY